MVAVVDPPLWLQNEQYPARIDRQLIAATMPEGIVRGLAVLPHSPAPDYTVNVNDGLAVIYGDDEDEQGAYLAVVGQPYDVTIAAPAGMNRIDLIVLRINDTQAGGPAGDNATIEVIPGAPTAGTPAPPALPPTAIEVSRITVAPSTTAIGAAQISGAARTFARGVGIIETYGGSIAPSWGLFCNGAAVDRTTYRDLFSVISTSFGAGNGTTTFNLPNYNGRSPFGLNAADTAFNLVGKVGGTANAVVVAHTHPIVHDHPVVNSGWGGAANINTGWGGTHDHSYSRMVESATKATGSSNAGTSLQTVNTSSDGNHYHPVTLPQHYHQVNVANFSGNSGAASGGVAGTGQNLPPYQVCTFVIRI